MLPTGGLLTRFSSHGLRTFHGLNASKPGRYVSDVCHRRLGPRFGRFPEATSAGLHDSRERMAGQRSAASAPTPGSLPRPANSPVLLFRQAPGKRDKAHEGQEEPKAAHPKPDHPQDPRPSYAAHQRHQQRASDDDCRYAASSQWFAAMTAHPPSTEKQREPARFFPLGAHHAIPLIVPIPISSAARIGTTTVANHFPRGRQAWSCQRRPAREDHRVATTWQETLRHVRPTGITKPRKLGVLDAGGPCKSAFFHRSGPRRGLLGMFDCCQWQLRRLWVHPAALPFGPLGS